jgi:hypothetical protein
MSRGYEDFGDQNVPTTVEGEIKATGEIGHVSLGKHLK